jgi:PAS domain S-box-containing protein
MIVVERECGIDVIGRVPWGTHFGLFYKNKQDLIDFLVPYFVAGLKNNEFCMWVTSEPLNAEDAKACVAKVLPNLGVYMDRGQIEFLPYTEWYTINGVFNPERVLDGWVEKLRGARERGFSGLRLTGNESWLEPCVWKDFIDYEQTVNGVIGQYNILAVCSYPRDKLDANDILDVVSTHQFVLTRRNGDWKIIEDEGQKKTRKALRDSEIHLAKSQEMAHIGSWEHDVATSKIERSAESYRIFGVTPYESDINYQDFLSLIVPEDRGRVDNLIKSTIKTGKPYTVTYNIRRKDDTVRTLMSYGEAVYDTSGRVVRLYGTNQDITESARAEESLKLTQFAMDNFRDSAIWIVLDGSIVYVNQETCKSLGYTREELLSMHIWDIDPEFPEERFRELWPEKRQGGYVKFESKHVARNGRVFPVEITSSYIKYGDKEYLITFGRDITERKQVEKELNAAKAQAELYVDLMGHDINNMNQISLGFLELAHNMVEMDGKLGEDNIVLLDKAMNALKSCSQLVDNVRKVQRVRLGEYETQVIDVGDMVDDVVKQFDNIPGRNVKITSTTNDHCLVHANALFKDVIINLVGNAVKHSRGVITVNVGVSLVTNNGNEYCRIDVEDDGPGIPDQLKSTLFDRLNLTNTRVKGKGFGLCLIKMLVDDYHGKFWVEDSVPGDCTKGARFVVMLPAVKTE